jgi:hypothetical protein
MEIGILGPLVVISDGVPVQLGAPRERALPVLLALRAGEPVSQDQLLDALWGGTRPNRDPTLSRCLSRGCESGSARTSFEPQPQGTCSTCQPFPNGATTGVQYEYWYMDANLRAVSGAYYSPWQYQVVGLPNFVYNGVTYLHWSYALPTFTLPTSGRLLVGARVAVWNGNAYEYSAWDVVTPLVMSTVGAPATRD